MFQIQIPPSTQLNVTSQPLSILPMPRSTARSPMSSHSEMRGYVQLYSKLSKPMFILEEYFLHPTSISWPPLILNMSLQIADGSWPPYPSWFAKYGHCPGGAFCGSICSTAGGRSPSSHEGVGPRLVLFREAEPRLEGPTRGPCCARSLWASAMHN